MQTTASLTNNLDIDIFECDGHTFYIRYEQHGNIRTGVVTYYDPAVGRRIRLQDIDSSSPYGMDFVRTSYTTIDDDPIKTQQRRNSAAMRLLDKIHPYVAAQQGRNVAEIIDNMWDDFIAYKREWRQESTRSQKYNAYHHYLRPALAQMHLPFTAADGILIDEAIRKSNVSSQTKRSYRMLMLDILSFLRKTEADVGDLILSEIPLTDEELISLRFKSIKSLSMDFRCKLIQYCVQCIDQQSDDAPLAMGILLCYCLGLRTSEMLAVTYGDIINRKYYYVCKQKSRSHVTNDLKTDNGYRALPIPTILASSVRKSMDVLLHSANTPPKVLTRYPIVHGKTIGTMMSATDFAAKARALFLDLGLPSELLANYEALKTSCNIDDVRDETSVCAYILRRDYITRLYSTDLTDEMITYLSAHGQDGRDTYRPSTDDLRQAAIALDQHYNDIGVIHRLPYIHPSPNCRPMAVREAAFALDAHETMCLSCTALDDTIIIKIKGKPGSTVRVYTTPIDTIGTDVHAILWGPSKG